MNLNRIFVLVTTALILSSCASTKMYDGPERSKDELATIKGMNKLDPTIPAGVSSAVKQLDGKEVPDMGSNLVILPGSHELVVSCSGWGANVTSQKIDLDARAGAEYYVGVNRTTKECAIVETK